VRWHGAWLTGNWKQGISSATTATPRKPCHAMGIARLGACNALQGAAANNTIETKDVACAADCRRLENAECGSPPAWGGAIPDEIRRGRASSFHGVVDTSKTEGRCVRRAMARCVADRQLGAGHFVCHNCDARTSCHRMGDCTSRSLQRAMEAAASNTIGRKDVARVAHCRRKGTRNAVPLRPGPVVMRSPPTR